MILNLNHFLIVLSIGLALQSCKPSSPKKSPVIQKNQVEKVPEVRPVVAETISTGKLYEFLMTVDPQYCDMDSLVEGDCNSGFLYFTPKGNMIYNYSCMGETSLCYEIGRVIYADDKISCVFDQLYKVEFPADNPDGLEQLSLQQLNSGKLQKVKKSTLQLRPLPCKEHAYALEQMADRYIVIPSDAKASFLKDILQIEALQKF